MTAQNMTAHIMTSHIMTAQIMTELLRLCLLNPPCGSARTCPFRTSAACAAGDTKVVGATPKCAASRALQATAHCCSPAARSAAELSVACGQTGPLPSQHQSQHQPFPKAPVQAWTHGRSHRTAVAKRQGNECGYHPPEPRGNATRLTRRGVVCTRHCGDWRASQARTRPERAPVRKGQCAPWRLRLAPRRRQR